MFLERCQDEFDDYVLLMAFYYLYIFRECLSHIYTR